MISATTSGTVSFIPDELIKVSGITQNIRLENARVNVYCAKAINRNKILALKFPTVRMLLHRLIVNWMLKLAECRHLE
jgi:hypothetical protein